MKSYLLWGGIQMPLERYGVLKAQPIAALTAKDSAHLEIHTVDDERHYRIAVNVKSQTLPPELRYIIFEDYKHPITRKLELLEDGFTPIESKPGDVALDYIRGNLFNYHDMKVANLITGPDNDLSEAIEKYIDKAIRTRDTTVYALGQAWGPEGKRDAYFGFKPGGGIHDIHMNQGNTGKWLDDNGTYQDGGLLIHFPAEDKWVAIFLAFQSQTFHTDDKTGNPIDIRSNFEENAVVIAAALLNPQSGNKTVSLLNTTPDDIDLSGWSLTDGIRNKYELSGKICSGTFVTAALPENALSLPVSGGIISLLDENGLKVNGVSYTFQDYSQKGKTITF
jgi:Uncharacterized conserved protein